MQLPPPPPRAAQSPAARAFPFATSATPDAQPVCAASAALHQGITSKPGPCLECLLPTKNRGLNVAFSRGRGGGARNSGLSPDSPQAFPELTPDKRKGASGRVERQTWTPPLGLGWWEAPDGPHRWTHLLGRPCKSALHPTLANPPEGRPRWLPHWESP